MIPCACGCGTLIEERDRWGGLRRFVKNHDKRGRTDLRGKNLKKVVGYGAVHVRLRTRIGPASAFACADCGGPAAHWSYKHKTGYSEDLADYEPRCVPCHRIFDNRED